MKTSKPHIAILITKSDIGGAQIHVLNLLRNLKEQFRFTLVCGEEGYLTEKSAKLGIETIILKNLQRQISPSSDYRGYREIRRLLAQLKPDCLHLHSSKAGLLGRLAAWREGIPVVFTAHGWAFTEGAGTLQRTYGLFAEWLLGHIGASVITVSQYDYQLALRFGVITPTNSWMIFNGVEGIDTLSIDRSPGLVNILNIGRMARAKNQKLLIEAASLVNRDFQLVIVGAGRFSEELERLAIDLGLAGKVVFTGTAGDTSAWFGSANIFALSSDYEGLPLSVIEAMSARLPIVATDVGGVSELVCDGENGFLVPRGDARAFARKLEILIDDAELRRKFGENSYQRFIDNFQAGLMCSKTAGVYEKVLSD